MGAKHQKISIDIPDTYGPDVRRAIAEDIVEYIRERSAEGLDKNNRPFAKYSKEYAESLDFKIAGKSKGSVDLTLSGDMLGALKLLSDRKGKLTIGFDAGSDENARADGNIRGTYGQSSQTAAKRDFLGLTEKDLERILRKYPVDSPERARLNAQRRLAEAKNIEIDTELEEVEE